MNSTFSELVTFRKQWRIFHNQQDHANADRLYAFAEAALSIPHSLPKSFAKELNAYGREWEKALCLAAIQEGFAIYKTELEVSVDQVAEFHTWIEALFHPEGNKPLMGTPLFYTTAENSTVMDGKWDAVFYFALHSKHSPDGLHLEKAPSLNTAKLQFQRVV